MNWMGLAEDSIRCRAVVSTVMNLSSFIKWLSYFFSTNTNNETRVPLTRELVCVFGKCSIKPLNRKRRLLYLKTQFVQRSKHFSSRL